MDDGMKNYLIGNAVMGNAAHEMRRTREDYQRRSAHQRKDEELSTAAAKFLLSDDAEGALDYLNESFMDEVIDDCRHQDDRNYSMETILVKRKAKYLPYYERIGKPMPEKLANLTADELCAMLGVKNLHKKDSRGNKDIIPYKGKRDWGDVILDWFWWIVLALFMAGMVVYFKWFY